MSSPREVIETTVAKVGAELACRALDPDDRVTITIDPDELIAGRRASRARVVAAGLSDDDIKRLIERAQKERMEKNGQVLRNEGGRWAIGLSSSPQGNGHADSPSNGKLPADA